MKLAVSNIAWTNEEEPAVAELLQRLGVRYVEVAPTKRWHDPTKASILEIQEYKKFWSSYDIEIVAFQSMLFSRPDLKIFESEDNRDRTRAYLEDFLGVARKMNVRVMVFGSPKNRQRGEMGDTEAHTIAKEFFGELGRVAEENDVEFCIEPNATQYACDFITTAQQGVDMVREVATPGFGLHLDIACMTLAGDDIVKSIHEAASMLRHFHISSPMLELVEDRRDINHVAAAAALRATNYDKFISIEMRPGVKNIKRVESAVRFVQNTYSS